MNGYFMDTSLKGVCGYAYLAGGRMRIRIPSWGASAHTVDFCGYLPPDTPRLRRYAEVTPNAEMLRRYCDSAEVGDWHMYGVLLCKTENKGRPTFFPETSSTPVRASARSATLAILCQHWNLFRPPRMPTSEFRGN